MEKRFVLTFEKSNSYNCISYIKCLSNHKQQMATRQRNKNGRFSELKSNKVMEIYGRILEGRIAEWAVKKYKSHR